ncbi:hypothetical protein ES703_43505 [subsurface metagenome]
MLLKVVSSTRLGSIIIKRTSLGEACSSRQQIIELRQTVLPLPVAPAISRWGIRDRSAATASPPAPLPSASDSLVLAFIFWKTLVSTTPRRLTSP